MKKYLFFLILFLSVGSNIFSMDISKLIDHESESSERPEKRQKTDPSINNLVNRKEKKEKNKIAAQAVAFLGKEFRCGNCFSYTTANASEYKEHLAQQHSDEKANCIGCSRKIKQTTILEHIAKAHSESFEYKCDVPGCDFKSSNKISFARHKGWHTEWNKS